jgi:hypothetical protein
MRVIPGMLEVADREREAMWEASAAMDRERRRRALDTERYEYHAGQAERLKKTMSQLVEHHERAAEKLLRGES